MRTDFYTDIGGRAINEDSVYVKSDDNKGLLIVADGLGGHGGGDLASQTAVRVVSSKLDTSDADDDVILDAICDASGEIAGKYPKSRTTIALLLIRDGSAYAAHVGDTRIYQFRDGKIIYQSKDHSMCQMYVTMGEISVDQIRGHVDRNKLLRALGEDENVRVELNEISVMPGDAFLLCSDGFWENIVEDEMIDSLNQSGSVNEWLSKMREIVAGKQNSESDNNTAAVCIA